MRPALPLALLCLAATPAAAQRTVKITPADLPKPYATPSANNGGKMVPRPEGAELTLPKGFKAEVFADGFENPRHVAVAPNGDLFVSESGAGRVLVLRPGSDGKPALRETFAEGLGKPFGVVFYRDWVYIGVPNSVLRYKYKPGQTKAEGEFETVVDELPTNGHWTRTLAYNPRNDKMYLALGSSMDVGEESDERRATVCEFKPDGSGFRVFASGLRNVIGMDVNPKTGVLYAAIQERDGLGDDLVPDYVTGVKEGGFYGWPWYYVGANHDPRVPEKPELAARSLVPDVLLTSHTAAMCLVFYTGKQFPKEYQGDAFLALHGSGNRSRRAGYSVVRLPFRDGKPTGAYQDFVTGWMLGEDVKEVWGRPVGLAQGKDGSLFLTDDGANKVWRISYGK